MTRPTRIVIVTPAQLRRERRTRIIINLVIILVTLWALWGVASFLSAALPGGH
jgi:hypothetical protein